MKFWFVVLLASIGASHADNAAIRDLRTSNFIDSIEIINGSKHGFSSRITTSEEREVIVQSLDKIAKSNHSDTWDRLYKPGNIVTLQQQEHILNAYTIITFLQEASKIPGRNLGEIFRETLDRCFTKTRSVLHVSKDHIAAFSGKILSLEGFLKQPFIKQNPVLDSFNEDSNKATNAIAMRRYLNVNPSSHYEYLGLSEAPIIHPYQPGGDERRNFGMLRNIFSVKLPVSAYMNLPNNIKDTLRSHNVLPQNTDIFFITQDNPWTSAQLLLRPHTWVKKNGQSVTVQAGIFSDDSSVTMDGTSNEVHAGQSHMHDGLSSPDNTMILSGIEYHATKSFYPVVIDGDRAAVSLHWILNDEDQLAIEDLSLRANNMQDFLAALKGNAKFAPHFSKLKSLMRY